MKQNFVVISHDPFARVEVIRRIVDKTSCDWCGQPARFQYGTHSDGYGARPEFDDHTFCGIQCHRSFHG